MNRLELLRYERGLSVAELAEKLSVSRQTIVRVEGGGRPKPALARALADAYETSVADILGVHAAETP